MEVETPLLSADTVVDTRLDPLPAQLLTDPRRPSEGEQMWLQTSPEFAMKRLVAAGATAIYQVCKAFRVGEQGELHNPEFTLVEWYRAGDDYEAGMRLLSDVSEALLHRGPAERMTYGDAFEKCAGERPHELTPPSAAEIAADRDVSLPDDPENFPLHAWIDLLFTALVQPQLGRGSPVILYDFPADQAALARIRSGRPPVAERFELLVDGVELANGYHELLDAKELRRRQREANAARLADGRYRLPEESRLLAAMEEGLPACCGCALGFDRAVMVATGAKRLDSVMAFPIDRA